MFPRLGRNCCESEVNWGLRVRLYHKTKQKSVPMSERFPGDNMWHSQKGKLRNAFKTGVLGEVKREGTRKKLLKSGGFCTHQGALCSGVLCFIFISHHLSPG